MKQELTNNFYTKSGMLSKQTNDMYHALCNCENRGERVYVYGKRWTMNGYMKRLIDRPYMLVLELCRRMDVSYRTGNDAPRGGRSGDYISIDKNEYVELRKILYSAMLS